MHKAVKEVFAVKVVLSGQDDCGLRMAYRVLARAALRHFLPFKKEVEGENAGSHLS